MTFEGYLELKYETEMTYIEKNCICYPIPIWAKKDLEVLEIIKAKKVNVWAVNFHKNYIKYNEFRDGDDRKLTEKEFNLIKEKLAND